MNLPLPATKSTGDTNDLLEIRKYLFRLVEQLNNSLNSLNDLTVQNTGVGSSGATSTGRGSGSLSPEGKREIEERAAELKSLIIKNAKIVEQEMDEMAQTFRSTYVAQSEYGTFTEYIDNRVTQTAAASEQSIQTVSSALGTFSDYIDNRVTQTAAGQDQDILAARSIFENYITTTNGYIRQGVVRYEGITPIIGIAIGQDITVTGQRVTVEGVEYEVIDTSHNMSIWTSEKLSFYVNGNEVAYFANNALHVSRIQLGNWEIDTSNGLLFKWTGV